MLYKGYYISQTVAFVKRFCVCSVNCFAGSSVWWGVYYFFNGHRNRTGIRINIFFETRLLDVHNVVG